MTLTVESLLRVADRLACPLGAVGRMVGAWEKERLDQESFSNALDLCLPLTC